MKKPEGAASRGASRAGEGGGDEFVLAIDCGTESIRAAVVDAEGNILSVGRAPIHTVYPAPGWAEQSPAEWEEALGVAVREALAASGKPPSSIRGVAADGTTSTVVCLDASGRAIREAILWSDIRAVEEARLIGATGDPILARAGGGAPSAEWFPCKALWIKRHEPETWNRTSTVFGLTDWLAWKLSGELTMNLNTATMRGFYDAKEGGVPARMYAAASMDDLPGKLPARTARPGELVGRLSDEAASRMGLPRGIPVAAGGGDAFIGTIGLDALEPGQVALITGSSHVVTAHVERPMQAKGLYGSFPDALYPGSNLLEGGLASSGSVLRWFTDNFIDGKVNSGAAAAGKSVLAHLDDLAGKIAPGSEGLTVLEHWQGSRCPWVDSASRGAIRGLSLLHGPAHLYRAIMEGVAFGTALILGRMEEAGVPIHEIRACGGPSRSQLWMQIHADVAGKPISLPREPESVLLGSAILAAQGGGLYASLREAASAMAGTSRSIQPNMEKHAMYKDILPRYVATYEALSPLAKAEAAGARP